VNDAKPALILVPGLLCTDVLWQAQLDGLADLADVRVTGEQTVHDNVAAIAAAILDKAPPRFALAGLSFGGYVCFEILRQAPERVARLALLDTSARADDDARRQQRQDLIELTQKGRFVGVTDRLLATFLHPDRLADASLTATVKEMALTVGRDGFVRQQRAIMGRPDSRADLPAFACPTLVLVGRQDTLTPLSLHEEIHAGIAGSELVVIEDCGHLAPMERPDEVTAAMRRWLG